MIESFLDRQSWKCLLGKMSKNIEQKETYATWTVYKRRHVVIFENIQDPKIFEKLVPFNFHYFTEKNVKKLKEAYKIKSKKEKSVMLDLEKTLNPSGKKYRGLRNRINRFKKLDIEVLNDYKDIEDIEDFVETWSNKYSLKYFRDNSGKNLHFYKHNFHKPCINSFCYYNGKLVAYGTFSCPHDGYSSFMIGKALYDVNPVLSEFVDYSLHKKAYELGAKYVLLGCSSTKGLLKYKKKFPGVINYIEYSGKVIK